MAKGELVHDQSLDLSVESDLRQLFIINEKNQIEFKEL